MPKYLVELVLVVEAKNLNDVKEITDHIVNMELPSKIDQAIESFRYEEITEIEEGEKACLNQE
ncbi:MAG: hypothetical protein QMD13_07095 [Candidatus Bathyarchaeia archaeon]|nr:hypothetical protein [Candidatus Bathyarchaeia archaeon]